jgi:hypothetical protein
LREGSLRYRICQAFERLLEKSYRYQVNTLQIKARVERSDFYNHSEQLVKAARKLGLGTISIERRED